MHESQSTACVCFIYSLVTHGLKRRRKKTRKFHSNKHGIPGAGLYEREKQGGRDKSVCMCVCWGGAQGAGGKGDEGGVGWLLLIWGTPRGKSSPWTRNYDSHQWSAHVRMWGVEHKKKISGWRRRKWFEALLSQVSHTPPPLIITYIHMQSLHARTHTSMCCILEMINVTNT